MSITFVTAGYRMNAGIRPTTCLIDVTESLDILQESLGDPWLAAVFNFMATGMVIRITIFTTAKTGRLQPIPVRPT